VQHSDIELLHASRAGHTEAFGRLVRRYQSLAWAVALGATGDPALSEEIAQEAFVTAWTELSTLRDLDKFSAWLCGIVRNLARYARRHQRRHAPGSPEDAGEHLARVACPGPSPLDQAISREQHGILRDALGRVPEAYRVPLILFYSERKSLEQVARCLDLSEQTVKQRLCRGRKYLKQSVEQRLARAVAASVPRAGLGVAVLAAISLSGGRASAATGWAALASTPRPWLGLAARSTTLAMTTAVAVTAFVIAGSPAPETAAPEAAGTSSQAHEMAASPDEIRDLALLMPDTARTSGAVLMGPIEITPAPRAADTTGAQAADTTAGTTTRTGEMAPMVRARRDLHHRQRTSPAHAMPRSGTTGPTVPMVPIVIERGPSAVTHTAATSGPSLSWHDALGALPPPSHSATRPAQHGWRLPIQPPDLRDRVQAPDL
jgi:RNA polymerase sigma factor (sigma-70 family)